MGISTVRPLPVATPLADPGRTAGVNAEHRLILDAVRRRELRAGRPGGRCPALTGSFRFSVPGLFPDHGPVVRGAA
ncbi:hypothetical protein GCM10010330_29790 [Streptomyces tendae]|nr:hypothetical protein GCM10010330_29790 [Streptomyces tendae]